MAHAPTQIGLERRSSGLLGGPGHAWVVGDGFWPALAATAARAVDLLMLAGGMLLVGRRLVGAWEPPQGPAALVIVSVVGGLLVTVGDFARRATGSHAAILSRAGLMLAAAALAIPLPARTGGRVLAMVALAGAAVVVARPWADRLRHRARRGHDLRPPVADEPPPAPAASPAPIAEPAPPPGQMLQRFERFTRTDGVECVRGRLFLAVPAGIRVAAGHVGFCPPFARTPTVEVSSDYDDVEAAVSASEALPWGVRIECRLDEPADDPFEIPIDFVAELPPASPPSA